MKFEGSIFKNKMGLIKPILIGATLSVAAVAAAYSISGKSTKPTVLTKSEPPIELAALSPTQTIAPTRDDALPEFQTEAYKPVIDAAIERIYSALSRHALNDALEETDKLLSEFPNFTLAHLLKGDILSLKAGRPVKVIGDVPKVPRSKRNDLNSLRAEAVARFKAIKDRPSGQLLPSELMVLNQAEKYIILVDASRSRLFLYENSFPHPRLVTDFYISQGRKGAVKQREGDLRTPIGVYTITELLTKEKITDFYGPMALPIDYPNSWDLRQGKTGYGIWLHGMPKTSVSRPPLDSEGCVVLANQDLIALRNFVDVGTTRVIISEQLDFVPADLWQVQRRTALRVIKSWKDDLEKGLNAGLRHYASNVLIDGHDLIDWQVSNNLFERSFGQIQLDDLTIVKYPFEEEEMMRVSFRQTDNVQGTVLKDQFWMKVGTEWKIVQEETTNL